MSKFCRQGRPIYYLDETWVNSGHAISKVWKGGTIKSVADAFRQGLSSGLKARESCLIVKDGGSEDGFVDSALNFMFGSKKTKDYHKDMDGEAFADCFKKLLGKPKPDSVNVMDNAPYHSAKSEKVPTKGTQKEKIQEWLIKREIYFEEDMIVREMLETVVAFQKDYDVYKVDEIAKERGHTVFQLPPYHCMPNPIELIWQMSRSTWLGKNKAFKLKTRVNRERDNRMEDKGVEDLFLEGIQRITAQDWKNCIGHAIREEEKMWELDGVIEISAKIYYF